MADNAPAPSGSGSPTAAAPDNQNAAPKTGTDPAKQPVTGTPGFDPSTLTNEDYEKVLSDPRAFTHPRFKALTERAAEADRLKVEAEQAANAQLQKDKKFEELATKHETSAKEWQGKYQTTLIDNKIQAEAAKLGITDFDAATKLLDRGGISINDDGSVNGVEAAVKALADSKSYLVDKSKVVPAIGNPTANPGDPNQPGTGATRQFKASEISDPKFYREHAKEIDAAFKAGVPILDDRGNTV